MCNSDTCQSQVHVSIFGLLYLSLYITVFLLFSPLLVLSHLNEKKIYIFCVGITAIFILLQIWLFKCLYTHIQNLLNNHICICGTWIHCKTLQDRIETLGTIVRDGCESPYVCQKPNLAPYKSSTGSKPPSYLFS